MGLGVKKTLKHYSYAWILSKTKMLPVSIWTEKIIFGLLSSYQRPGCEGCSWMHAGVRAAGWGRCSLAAASFHSLSSQIFHGVNLNDGRHGRELGLLLAVENSARQDWIQWWLICPSDPAELEGRGRGVVFMLTTLKQETSVCNWLLDSYGCWIQCLTRLKCCVPGRQLLFVQMSEISQFNHFLGSKTCKHGQVN